ncbi:MAG: toxin-antitoxin system YwqK family antitoxin [Bacteroidetes bacterium]|nr:toxin-antitoxin system YwqK family antitoxin [Bacteroidota bacterium]
MKKVFLIVLIIASNLAFAQTYEMAGTDTINLTDVSGKKQGKWIVTNKMVHKPCYTDDQKVEEGIFESSKKIGIWTEYYCNNNLKSKITYENNRPNGYAIMYHENGKPKEEGLWKNNRWVGDYKLYYENGQVQQAFKFNTTGKRAGDQKYYYENGQTMIEGSWAEGKEAGILKEYYENGDLKSEKNFADGFLDVASVKTYEPKKPIIKEVVKEVVVDPIKVAPIEVDKGIEKVNSGKPFDGEGKWKLYNKNKQVSKDGVFHSNKLIDGKVYIYNTNGILTRIALYKGGKYIGDSVIEE